MSTGQKINSPVAVIPTATSYRGQTIRGWVEVSVVPGIGIHLVGLADSAVKETLLRVVTALQYKGYRIPGKKIVINTLRERGFSKRKHGDVGGWFDLPIALGILLASGQIQADEKEVKDTIFVGQLDISGRLVEPDSGFVSPVDAARAVSWKYRDEHSVWGWDTDCKGGNTWLDVKDLADAIELLENTIEKKEDRV